MEQITQGQAVRVGVDLAKRVIQVHAVDAGERVLTGRALSRENFMPWCARLPAGSIVAMEASSSAHHWARKLIALGLDARIISAQLVSPYRREGASGKNDANDAAAICEAASRARMRFIPVKSVEQQSMLCVHRLREGLTRLTLQRAQAQWHELDAHLAWCDERIAAHGHDNAAVKTAATLLGIGPVTASAVVATVGDFKQFKSGAQSAVMTAHRRQDRISAWALALRERSGWQKAVVALANKNARILWAVMTHGEAFDPNHLSTKPVAG